MRGSILTQFCRHVTRGQGTNADRARLDYHPRRGGGNFETVHTCVRLIFLGVNEIDGIFPNVFCVYSQPLLEWEGSNLKGGDGEALHKNKAKTTELWKSSSSILIFNIPVKL